MTSAYFAPLNLDEALDAMQDSGAVVLAGGTDFFPALGRAPFSGNIVDITRVQSLRGLKWSGDWMRIGAATTWSDVIRFDLPPAFDALKSAARMVGGIQIQNSGTVAGNICNASPAADGVPPLLTLGAEIELASASGTRRMPLDTFLYGPRQTALKHGELVTALHVPRPPAHTTSAFEKLGARKYLVISIAMTAVIIGVDSTGRIDFARICVGSCAPTAMRLNELENDLIGTRPDAVSIQAHHLEVLAPITDVRADNVYRLEAVPHQITRAIRRATVG